MGLSPFLVYEPADGPDEVATLLAVAWAERVLECADEVDRAEDRHGINLRVGERMDYDSPPDENESFRRLWVAHHTLVWSCGQLLQWLKVAIDDVDQPNFASELKTWRNALEHLDESNIEGAMASADEAKSKPQSIRNIGTIMIGNSGSAGLASFASTADIREWVGPMISA
ncbi:hypothetical protein [Leifsonia aquatica]|uniref:hypothetical protein n=1 Tax=Leifsonia aquatica TaxID=144185 RepID=UPI0038153476